MQKRIGGCRHSGVEALRRSAFSLLCVGGWVCAGWPVRAQSADVVAQFQKGPHTGPVEQALVGVEVVFKAKDGTPQEIRHGNGFVLRSDGFVLLPTGLLGSSTGTPRFDRQSLEIVLNPGTPLEKRVTARPPRFVARRLDYVVTKLESIHTPALRTLLPDALKAGDEIQVVWSRWDEAAHHFMPPERRAAKLGGPPKDKEAALASPGTLLFAEPLEAIPAGAVVLGPEGMAIGLVPGASAAPHPAFISTAALYLTTNCVSPVPLTDMQFADRQKGEEKGKDDGNGDAAFVVQESGEANKAAGKAAAMVTIPGGPLTLPNVLRDNQPDMERASIACIAPFQIDREEVTNRQYLDYWNSLPAENRKSEAFRLSNYPITWADAFPPFPATAADVPVLGVPLPGALAYAKAQGKRLPTPYEWCLAALGAKGEGAAPEWIKRYLEDRQNTAQRVQNLHVAYVNGTLLLHGEDFLSGPNALTVERLIPGDARLHGRDFYDKGAYTPWLAYNAGLSGLRVPIVPGLQTVPFWAEMTEWSRRTVEAETDHLWRTWQDPLYVLPVGTRSFDVSPYGARDMLLNACEQVMPYPTTPYEGATSAMQVAWLLPKYEDIKFPNFLARPRDDKAPFLPLSRLLSRSSAFPPADLLTAMTNVEEAREMLRPFKGWELRMVSGLSVGSPWFNSPSVSWPSGLQMWIGKPPHFHTEIGRPIPISADETYRSFFDLPLEGKLIYALPIGFRCAR